MKKILAALFALVMMLSAFGACAENAAIYEVIALAQEAIASDSTDFTMTVSYNEQADIVVFTTVMHTMDWALINSSKHMPEFQNVILSLLDTNIAMKGVVEAYGLPQDVVGLLVTSDGAIVAAYYNDVDITPLVTGY